MPLSLPGAHSRAGLGRHMVPCYRPALPEQRKEKENEKERSEFPSVPFLCVRKMACPHIAKNMPAFGAGMLEPLPGKMGG